MGQIVAGSRPLEARLAAGLNGEPADAGETVTGALEGDRGKRGRAGREGVMLRIAAEPGRKGLGV